MPQLLIQPSQDLAPDVRCQVLSFMRIYAPQVFQSQPIGWDFIDPATRPMSVMLMEDRTLISHVLVTWRALVHAGENYAVGGFSAVFTYPEFRGQGYGQRVVAEATRLIQQSDADVALLRCKPELYAFYATSGWEHSAAMRARVGTADAFTEDGRLMLLCVSPRGHAHRAAFEAEPVQVGAYMW